RGRDETEHVAHGRSEAIVGADVCVEGQGRKHAPRRRRFEGTLRKRATARCEEARHLEQVERTEREGGRQRRKGAEEEREHPRLDFAVPRRERTEHGTVPRGS